MADQPTKCLTCDGRGEVGGFVSADSGYQTDACPDCEGSGVTLPPLPQAIACLQADIAAAKAEAGGTPGLHVVLPMAQAEAILAALTPSDAVATNLAMMLRRMIWQARKEVGDSSMKTLAGKAGELLRSYGLQGDILRDG